ncbi:MAG: glycosyltransferase [Nitriliruptoraceae bacterium]
MSDIPAPPRPAPRTLLVASAGGHLTQLHRLRERLGVTAPLWATYGVPQAEELLAGEQVLHAHHPTTKHLGNAVRNYLLARRVLATYHVERVISTGAAISVPFVLRARQLGIPSYYLESATRVDGPSLSGRMLERLPGIQRYRQLGDWGGTRWRQGPSVFDGFHLDASPEAVRPIRRVVVSLGTHRYPFSTLLARLAPLLARLDAEVLWQLGSTPAPPGLPGEHVTTLPPDELRSAIAAADVVVGHAGVGLTLTALSAGTVPVLIPRRRSRHEHTDDHQVQLARELERQGLAVATEVGGLSGEHLERAAGLLVREDEPPPFDLAALERR